MIDGTADVVVVHINHAYKSGATVNTNEVKKGGMPVRAQPVHDGNADRPTVIYAMTAEGNKKGLLPWNVWMNVTWNPVDECSRLDV